MFTLRAPLPEDHTGESAEAEVLVAAAAFARRVLPTSWGSFPTCPGPAPAAAWADLWPIPMQVVSMAEACCLLISWVRRPLTDFS